MAWAAGLDGWGQSRCRARLTCQQVYLCLTTRGLDHDLLLGRSLRTGSATA